MTDEGRAYAFCDVFLSWADARDSCLDAQADLARIDDTDENSFIGLHSQIIFDEALWTWIGGHDSDTEGQWFWLGETQPFWSGDQNGTEHMFTKWHATDPNGGVSENCAALWPGLDEWLDLDCESVQVYVCEYP